MKTFVFARRVAKEILRDPLSLAFGIGFPVILLLLLGTIQKNIPVEMFVPEQLTPGIAVFGLSFLALFSAMLISRDRATSMLGRLFTTPMKASDFILGYTLPLLPMALCQGIICYAVAACMGLKLTWHLLPAILSLLPVSLIYIAIGLLCGSVMNEKQATSVCGAILTNLSAWLSGTWFSLDLVGEGFRNFANLLPFSHAVDLGRALLTGTTETMLPHLWVVLGYAVVLLTVAVLAFHRKMQD